MKNNIDLTLIVMKKKGIKRINLLVDEDLFKQIKSKADEAYLKIATFTRQLIQQVIKNNSINNKIK
jgi:hypothetical protein